MTQQALFTDPPRETLPYQPHSPTSRAAAESVENPATLRAKVLAYLQSRKDGATDEEIGAALHMAGNTARPRRIELVQRGLVRDSGRKRATASGRSATAWEAI